MLEREQLLCKTQGLFENANDCIEIVSLVSVPVSVEQLTSLEERPMERGALEKERLILSRCCCALGLLLKGCEIGDSTHTLKLLLCKKCADRLRSGEFWLAKHGQQS